MGKVRITILESKCIGGYHNRGEIYEVYDDSPPICHELCQKINPSVYTLLNGGDLDFGDERRKEFKLSCPDGGRVKVKGEVIE